MIKSGPSESTVSSELPKIARATHSEEPWDRGLQILLVMIVAFNLIPHTLVLPPWITACCATALIWKLLILLRGLARPPRLMLSVATVAFSVGVFMSFHTLVGQEAAGALLALLASLKLLETNRYRDAMMITFVSYFLLMAHLLSSQSLLSTIFMALDVLLITTLMFHLHKKDRRSSVRSFRPVMRTLAMTLPVWIFLFLVFPRFSTGFWKAPSQTAPSTAFSDQLDPGSVSHLVDSDDLAFRVDFGAGGLKISPESIYWRGTILTNSTGLSWTKETAPIPGPEHTVAVGAVPVRLLKPISYQVFLESGYHRWIFALDFPADITANESGLLRTIVKKPGFNFEFSSDSQARVVYSGVSNSAPPAQLLSQAEYDFYSRPPVYTAAAVKVLADQLANHSANAGEASRAILKYFDAKNFHYTHSPGSIPKGQDQLEYFLFHMRQGFCEHYAGSFATLMRLMGYPSRVVIGFQGGKYNDYGQYLLVRSLDAHAWAEIWVAEEGNKLLGRWTRVDPTELVAPLRLQLGGDFNRLDASSLAQGLTPEELRQHIDGGFLKLQLRGAMAWDAVQMKWNGFLMLYDFDYQKSLLDRLGFKSNSRWIFIVWMAVGVFLFVIVLYWAVLRRARFEDPLLISWHEFCRRVSKLGITRFENEGPEAFCQRVLSSSSGLSPETTEAIRQITAQFVDLRYGSQLEVGKFPPGRLREFRQSVRRFSIKAISRSAAS